MRSLSRFLQVSLEGQNVYAYMHFFPRGVKVGEATDNINFLLI